MSKAKQAAVATTPAPAQQATTYVVGARGNKYSPKQGFKWAAGGNEGTWAAILAAVAANGGTITAAQLREVCASMAHKGYAGYVLRNNWLVPAAQ